MVTTEQGKMGTTEQGKIQENDESVTFGVLKGTRIMGLRTSGEI